MANPNYRNYYVGPDQVLKHIDKDLLEKLGRMAYHGLLFSEAFSDHGTSACQVIGPSTIEAFLTSSTQEGYSKQHGKKGRLIHTNSNIARELGWSKIEHDKWLQQSSNFVRDVFKNPALKVEVSGLLSSCGVSKTGGFCHIDHKHQIILHLDSNGPKSTVIHRQKPQCNSSYEYLFPMLSYLPDSLLSCLQNKHAEKIDAVAKAVGLTATELEDSVKHFFPTKKKDARSRKKRRDFIVSSEGQWSERAKKQQPLEAPSPFVQKLAVVMSRLQQLSMMENVDWDSLPDVQGGLSWKLEKGNMFHDWGGLLCINPHQMEPKNVLNADKEFELSQMTQYSATKFCGSIHTNPDRSCSRAVVLLAAREVKAQKNGPGDDEMVDDAFNSDDDIGEASTKDDEMGEAYTGAEQITQLHLLSALYEDLVLDSTLTSFPGEEDDPDLWDWLHMMFLELMFQNVRCVDAPYSYYYLLRSLHQNVFYAGLLIRMAFDEKIMLTKITKLHEEGTVSKGRKGGKKISREEKEDLLSLQRDLLKRAKDWKAMTQEEKEELKDRVESLQHPKEEPKKSGEESGEESDEEHDEALWLSFWKKQFERNTYYFKMHPSFIDEDEKIDRKKEASTRRSTRAKRNTQSD